MVSRAIKSRGITVLQRTASLTSEHLNTFPKELHRPIIYSRFLRLQKFVSTQGQEREAYRSIFRRKIKNESIPSLLRTLEFVQFSVVENPENDYDKKMANQLLWSYLYIEKNNLHFLKRPTGQRYLQNFIRKDFDKYDMLKGVQHYYETLDCFNKSFGTCL